jgi:nicotinamidase-related amidase
MTTALVLIDIQNDYFPDGAYPLPGSPEAVVRAREVLDDFRAREAPIVHVQHVWDAPDAAFFAPGTAGVEIHAEVAPLEHERWIVKTFPNAFRETNLDDELSEIGATELVIVGMQSNLCIDATARAAADLGYEVTVVADACAAADLEYSGVAVPAASVHAAFMAGLENYGAVLPAAEVLAR